VPSVAVASAAFRLSAPARPAGAPAADNDYDLATAACWFRFSFRWCLLLLLLLLRGSPHCHPEYPAFREAVHCLVPVLLWRLQCCHFCCYTRIVVVVGHG